ncbi:hypothetical protein KBY88_03335 [Cyanobium sp. Morenito 9A2]|nr:hypothetical protein [Cyanobium sp. Morenito 9A2]
MQVWATGCEIHKALRANEKPSDHAPIVVRLQMPEEEEHEESADEGF